MNRRDMKKLIQRELGFFLNNKNQKWSSIPDWFHHLRLMAFRGEGTTAEKLRLDEVMTEFMMELITKGGGFK
tara:strand:+ start:713 stop:928 length:216 start_codon:yes stop_codon:yes gene_type:complete